MDNKQLLAKIAQLETRNDYLETELSILDQQLVLCGFDEGLKTLRETVEEVLAEV